MSKSDDIPVGRILSRREALTVLGLGTAMVAENLFCSPLLANAAKPACLVRPEETEGPYFVDELLNRSDIRSDPATGMVSEGIPLVLSIHVNKLTNGLCAPLAGAMVDIWHCDHLGYYSDEKDSDFDTSGKKFLRGFQITTEAGEAQFRTVYPGWYLGRTTHIHVKIRSTTAAGAPKAKGSEFTSQMYFDDTITDTVYKLAPYSTRGPRKYRNSNDFVFPDGGEQLMLKLSSIEEGYRGEIDFAVTDWA